MHVVCSRFAEVATQADKTAIYSMRKGGKKLDRNEDWDDTHMECDDEDKVPDQSVSGAEQSPPGNQPAQEGR
jgi:hypothetical protein